MITLRSGLMAWFALEEDNGPRLSHDGRLSLADNATVTGADGPCGRASQFVSANSEFLSGPHEADVGGGDRSLTVAGWVWLDDVSANHVFISKGTGAAAANSEYAVRYGNTSTKFEWLVSNGAGITTLASTGSPEAGQWYHLIGWTDGGTLGLRVDQRAGQGTAFTGPMNTTTGQLFVGKTPGAVPQYHNGRLYGWGVWNRVLSGAEQAALYNGGVGLRYPFWERARLRRARSGYRGF